MIQRIDKDERGGHLADLEINAFHALGSPRTPPCALNNHAT